ncbi:hypothetical protein M0804_009558 [Polistes exclamans]|nr:hypothetical protein M0804_009558 [Polistes exclamans]
MGSTSFVTRDKAREEKGRQQEEKEEEDVSVRHALREYGQGFRKKGIEGGQRFWYFSSEGADGCLGVLSRKRGSKKVLEGKEEEEEEEEGSG